MTAAGCLSPAELDSYKAFVKSAMRDKALLDRQPALPPFRKGATLKYVGPDEALRDCVGLVTWVSSGMRGDLTQIHDLDNRPMYWNDDKDAPILIRTVDGASGVMVNGKCVRVTAENAYEWELLRQA